MNRMQFYVTTPIYYVNDRAHIGHIYTTTIADVVARYHRLRGRDTFFLTGTDEHAAKVADAAAERGKTAQQWADENAASFQETFARLGMSHDDFIRTSQDRHKQRVLRYVRELLECGDVYAGEYEGWYDAGQEEYITENKARELDYKSPITGRPLVRKRERNYFFRLSAYADALRQWLNDNPRAVLPEARRNEVLGRLGEGLNDVPISRTGTGGWGISVPGDAEQTIYVWIDALFNYLTTVDTDPRRHYWPADVHFIGKDILWFHAVIWPAVLMALGRRPGFEWVKLPRCVYAHSFWIAEGMKMSKTMGNFIDLEKIDAYIAEFGLDALRHFLTIEGPLGNTDGDFAHARFIEIYNSELANTLGNCISRVCNMAGRYLDGALPAAPEDGAECREAADRAAAAAVEHYEALALDRAGESAIELVRAVDAYIERTQPFKLARDPAKKDEVGAILARCAEALRIATVLLWPILPNKMAEAWARLGCADYAAALTDRGRGRLDDWLAWGQLPEGTRITQGPALFPRHQEAK